MNSKNNFLPLLLIGGGAAAAILLYGYGTKKDKEDLSVVDGLGTVGSGDFLGSSGVSKGYDSIDLGIEDFANNRATPMAFGLPSDGANPEKVLDDSGEWSFNDTAMIGLTAGITAAPYAVKGVKNVVTKAAGNTASQAVKSTATKAASTATSSGAKALNTLSKIKLPGVAGLGLGAAGVAFTVLTEFTQPVSAVAPEYDTAQIYDISQNISTDLAAKVGIGNMVTDRQVQHASGLSGAKYPISLASKEESALVNQATGSTGDVLKVSGDKFTSYVPEKGMQIAYSNGGTLKQAVNAVNARKAAKRN